MRLFFILTVTLVTMLAPLQLTNAASNTAASGTLFGKVHNNGVGVRNILVEVMSGSCFSRTLKTVRTNAAGYYRFNGLKVGTPVHIGVNGFSSSAKNRLFKAKCGKGIKLRAGQLNRHNVALESSRDLEKRQCLAAGGTWGFITRGFKGCNYTYTDGGKQCTDGRQCQSGACLARQQGATSGFCATSSSNRTNSCGGTIRNSRWFPKACH